LRNREDELHVLRVTCKIPRIKRPESCNRAEEFPLFEARGLR